MNSMNYNNSSYMNSASYEKQRFYPPWAEELSIFYRGRIARLFILHFNLTDYAIDTSEEGPEGDRKGVALIDANRSHSLTFREYLHQFLFREFGCHAIYTYSLAGGMTTEDAPDTALSSHGKDTAQGRLREAAKEIHGNGRARKQQVHARERLQGQPQVMTEEDGQQFQARVGNEQQEQQPAEAQEVDISDDIAENFKVLGHLLSHPYYDQAQQERPNAVILDYAEKLIPYHLGEGQGDREQLQALEVVQRWAFDPLIRDTMNLAILLTNNIGLIPSNISAEGSGCRSIRIPLPTEGERKAHITHSLQKGLFRQLSDRGLIELDPEYFKPGHSGQYETLYDQAHILARGTQGMRLIDIDHLMRRVIVEHDRRRQPGKEAGRAVLRQEDLQQAKSEVIESQSAQLLEIVPPVRGFNEIGGLEKLKGYLKHRSGLMLSGDCSPLVPSGLLLAGPPGTGKTIIAEALATESGFNLVKMRNIQDKWIGSSERNLEVVLSLLKDLNPVIVFVDEIDQAMVRRDTGHSGDGGVGARMFARILEEMSNGTKRGQVLWVAATNRADLLDAALLRRFDRVVPLLPPDVEESCRIFATILKMIIKQSKGTIYATYGDDLAQSGRISVQGHPDPTDEDLNKFRGVAQLTARIGLTGAMIEIVVRRAIEIVYEENPGQSTVQGNSHTQMSLSSRHLLKALQDFKPNHNRLTYDQQSLLALDACNFRSIIPRLPMSGVYRVIQDEEGNIVADKLARAIQRVNKLLQAGHTQWIDETDQG